MNRRTVLAAIDRERNYQDTKHGRYMKTTPEWVSIIRKQLDKVDQAYSDGDIVAAMRELLQATSAGVAAIEQNGLYERDLIGDYDKLGDRYAE